MRSGVTINELDAILARLAGLPDKERAALAAIAEQATAGRKFIPLPGPQSEAYFTPADVLFYGGAGGGGKSSLLIGLALTEHRVSLIMRRQYTDLDALTEEAIRINGTRSGFNGSVPPKIRTPDGRLVTFGAAAQIGSEQSFQGRARDFLGVDEVVQFAESQVRFLMGWTRTTRVGQRCRTVFASNPPVSAEGDWVIGMFRPWLDLTHDDPASPGELRWFITDPDGKDMEVSGPTPVTLGGEDYIPHSRTFIPAALKDNPYLLRTGYKAAQDAMQEPWRSAIRDGNFAAARKDHDWQVIRTQWIAEAQARWTPQPPDGIPMCVIAADIACGGDDETVIGWRHDNWFSSFVAVPGAQTPLGQDVAALVVKHRRDSALVTLDMGGGYGGSPKEHLEANGVEVKPYRGSEGTSLRTADRQYGFANTRTAAVWRLREALDPSQPGGSLVALPPDPKLMADLSALRWTITPRGIKVESKEEVCDRLGRSSDRGDTVVMANFCGPKYATHRQEWSAQRRPAANWQPKVLLGHEAARRKRG